MLATPEVRTSGHAVVLLALAVSRRLSASLVERSVVFGVVGMALLIAGYYVFELVTSYSVSKELVEDDNVAVGVVVGSVIIGMAIVIAASIPSAHPPRRSRVMLGGT